ncbi:PRTRC system protein D [Pseudorhodoferax soli]|uniref:Plasmid segregation protein ParM n=1 Tax=Pseudorhodoferax soli TaxID=545864 RepID=A0A368XDQ6_9BURK|nr:PRTRC system protein D [Pseudorhodoferax soli]RCW65158.1 plasmid segregation protein ParM [Pseudorhodoferax soli]
MSKIVRAIDVGFGNTKFVVGHTPQEVKCGSFPSLAYVSAKDSAQRTDGQRRRTVSIPIDKLFYEVGPDVHLAADTFRGTQLHDRYIETPEYLALARGALSYMRLSTIDLLVVGLPVASFQARKAQLERLMTGVHDVGAGKTVEVRKAVAVAQPQGALVHFTAAYGKQKTIAQEQSLIIDPGSRTFDWLLSRGMRLVSKVSSSVNRGMSDVLKTIAQEISSDIGRPYSDLPAIDTALRTGKPLLIYQKPYDLTPILPTAHAVARGAVSSMMEWIAEDYSIQNVILVGGGAFMFKDAVKAAFPKHKIHVIKDPMFANVKGFQIAGANLLSAEQADASSEES